MPPIKSPSAIAAKWVRATAGRTADYEEGVKNPRRDWLTETAAANDSYKTALSASIARDAWLAGVTRAGSPKWLRGVLAKGISRWAPGVAAAEDAYKSGFAPYAEVISRVTLPPRGPRGDPGNIQRVAVLAAALHNAKLAMAS